MNKKVLITLVFCAFSFILISSLNSKKVAAADCNWFGGGSDNWNDASNWDCGVPQDGDNLFFPGDSSLTSTNDIVGLEVGTITTQGPNHIINGNGFSITNGISGFSGGSTINAPVTVAANQGWSIDSPDTLTVENIILNADLTFNNIVVVNGTISGAGSITIAPGATVTFSVGNTFVGDVESQGNLVVRDSDSLGNPANQLVVNQDGALILQNNIFLSNSMTFNTGSGVLNSTDVNEILGNIELNDNVPFSTASGILILSGEISGTGGITKQNDDGTLRFTGSGANTFEDDLIIEGGTVELDKLAGELAAGTANIIVGDGLGDPGTAVLLFLGPNLLGNVQNVEVLADGLLDMGGFNDAIGELVVRDGHVNTNGGLLNITGLQIFGGEIDTDTGILTIEGNVIGSTSDVAQAVINGNIDFGSDDRTILVTGGILKPELKINAVITGTGKITFNKLEGGVLGLAGANTFTGDFVASGGLYAYDVAAFGTTVGKTTVNGNGYIVFDASGHFDENFEINGNGRDSFGSLNALGLDTRIWGDITLNTDTNFGAYSSRSFQISGNISGNHSITLSIIFGAGETFFMIEGHNTFTGNVILNPDINLFAASSNSLNENNNVFVPLGATLHMGQYGIGDGVASNVGSVTGQGVFQVESGGGGGSVTIGNSSSFTFDGDMIGDGDVIKIGSGTWTLTGGIVNTGTFYINEGKVLFNGTQPYPNIVLNGGTLGGHGSIGNVIGNTGFISPGNSPGIINIYGNLTLNPTMTTNIELNSPIVETGYDQIIVDENVSLGNSILRILPGYTPTLGTVFTIITSTGTITGTFAGLPNGSTITVNGLNYTINYTATSVTLTFVGGSLAGTGIELPIYLMTLILLITFVGIIIYKKYEN